MAKTIKNISVGLTKESLKELDELCKFYEENRSTIVRRAISSLYQDEVNFASLTKAEETDNLIRKIGAQY